MPLALDDLGPRARGVVVDVPDDLPEVLADPGLLERVVANLVANALRYSPAGQPAAGHRQRARRPRRAARRRPRARASRRTSSRTVFAPFQRLGDTDNTTGVGLGLALSRGLTEAMGGTLTPEETPGGGLTMVVVAAARRPAARPRGARSAASAT